MYIYIYIIIFHVYIYKSLCVFIYLYIRVYIHILCFMFIFIIIHLHTYIYTIYFFRTLHFRFQQSFVCASLSFMLCGCVGLPIQRAWQTHAWFGVSGRMQDVTIRTHILKLGPFFNWIVDSWRMISQMFAAWIWEKSGTIICYIPMWICKCRSECRQTGQPWVNKNMSGQTQLVKIKHADRNIRPGPSTKRSSK